MSKPRPVLHRPVLSEKTMNAAERRDTYCFEVDLHANKIEIRRAVEAMFPVKVLEVRTLIRKGKTRARRRATGGTPRVPDRKRAFVRIQDGQKIDLF